MENFTQLVRTHKIKMIVRDNAMVLSVGEVLFDIYAKKTESGFAMEAKIGGAPYNVACGIKKLGGRSAFVGCVGEDAFGDRLFEMIGHGAFSELLLVRDKKKRNTPLAIVRNAEDGERAFTFCAHDTSDLHLPPVPLGMMKKSRIVHIGSLVLRTKRGQNYAAKLAEKAHKLYSRVSFDCNYRPGLFGSKKAAVEAIKAMIPKADLIKLSEEETELLGSDFIDALPPEKLICITKGENGCEWRYNGESHSLPSLKVKAVDTTGCGDAFWAGALYKLTSIAKKELTAEKLDEIFSFACRCGAFCAKHRGATFPTEKQALSLKSL